MALTNQEIISAENDYIDTDGIAFQFSRSAILAFIRDRLSIEQAAYGGKAYIKLLEEGVGKPAASFSNFVVDLAASIVLIVENGAVVSSSDLASWTDEGGGVYSLTYAPTVGKTVAFVVDVATSFTNPTTANNPSAVEEFDVQFYEALRGSDVDGVKFDAVAFALSLGKVISFK